MKNIGDIDLKAINTDSDAEPHPIFSAIIDLYLAEMVYNFISSVILFFYKNDLLITIFQVSGLLVLVLVVSYHAKLADQVLWLSPGEIVGGKVLDAINKKWTNPYKINRFGIYLIIFLSLLTFRGSGTNMWSLASIEEIIGFSIRFVIVTISILLLGRGKLIGVAFINIILLASFGYSLIIDNDAVKYSGYFSLTLFFIFSIIAIVYHIKKKLIVSTVRGEVSQTRDER